MPRTSPSFPSSRLLTLPPPWPGHRQGRRAPGSGLVSTSQDGEVLPPARPALCPGLEWVKGALSPGGTALRFPGATFWVAPKQWSLRPRPGQAGGSRWCIRGRRVCPSDQVSRLPELQGSVTFSADASPSTYPSGPAAQRPAQAPGPDRPGARGRGGEGGLGEGPRRAQGPLPPSLGCSCVTTEEPREVPQPSRSRL